jgi:CRP-like cAMP-binding protein
VLYRSVLLRSLNDYGECLQLMSKTFEGFSPQLSVKDNASKLKKVSLFKEAECSEDFLEYLAEHLEDRMYLKGMRIIDENHPGDRCMYFISSGSAKKIVDGVEVATLAPGAVVGEIAVLGLESELSGSVIAVGTCDTQVLHQSIVVKGLELFPDEREKILMMAFHKKGVDDEEHEDVSLLGSASKRLSVASTHRHRAFLRVMKASPLFATTSPDFVEELSHVAIDRIYMPGDLIIEQGTKGDSMFIMVSGQAGVLAADRSTVTAENVKTAAGARVGTLHAGSITGELAMLGVLTVRSATIEAEHICSMWEIPQDKALALLERYPDARQKFQELIIKHLERTVPARVSQLKLFKDFDRKLITLLGLYSDRLVFFPGQVIVREGQTGNMMYIINLGKASLEKKGVAIKNYTSGSYFGSTLMLGVHNFYIGTLVVLQTCHVLGISRSHYLQGLHNYPSPTVSNELKLSEKKITEELGAAIQKISARKFIWKRYQGMLNPETQDASDKVLTDSEMIHSVFQCWYNAASESKKRREGRDRERTQYRHMMENWVRKKRETMVRLKRRQDEEQLRLDAVCPHRQRAAEEKPKWEPSRRGRHPLEALPPVTQAFSAATPDSARLMDLLKDWPTPRQSKFYTLNLWNVLADSLDAPASSPSPLLPLLTGPPNTAETDPNISGEPLCASPADGAADHAAKDMNEAESETASEEDTMQEILAHSYCSETDEMERPGFHTTRSRLSSLLDDISSENEEEEDKNSELALQFQTESRIRSEHKMPGELWSPGKQPTGTRRSSSGNRGDRIGVASSNGQRRSVGVHHPRMEECRPHTSGLF